MVTDSCSIGQGTFALYLSSTRSSVGVGFPLAHEKLVSRIEAGEYIDCYWIVWEPVQ